MKSLEQFQNEMQLVMQRLGGDPTLEEVDKAGRELVQGGIPDGARLEGLLILRDRAASKSRT